MAAVNKLKSAGKKIIGYPEETVTIVSSRDWIKNQAQNPRQRVSTRVIRCSLFTHLPFKLLGDQLCCQSLSNCWVDNEIQLVVSLGFDAFVF